MPPDELERYLHCRIPLSAAMGVSVLRLDERAVTLRAPLAPNINHRQTVFGGSASAVAMLAAWSLLHSRLTAAGLDARLVIRRNTMEFEAPIAGDFEAEAAIDAASDWAAFTHTLERRGKARIGVAVVLRYEGQTAATFAGEFVAMRPPQRSES